MVIKIFQYTLLTMIIIGLVLGMIEGSILNDYDAATYHIVLFSLWLGLYYVMFGER